MLQSIENTVTSQLSALSTSLLSSIPIPESTDILNIGTELMDLLNFNFNDYSGNVLFPRLVCANSSPDIGSLADSSGVSSCEHLDFTNEADVIAFGYESDNGMGLCGAVDWNSKTYGLAFTDIFKIEIPKLSITFELNALGLSLSGSLSQESINEIDDWQGVPAKRTFWGHFYIKATLSYSKDIGAMACKSMGIPDNQCSFDGIVAIGIDAVGTVLTNADPDSIACDDVNPFDSSDSYGTATYISVQVIPTFSLFGMEIPSSVVPTGDVDVYTYTGIHGSEAFVSAKLNSPKLSDFAPADQNFGALAQLFGSGNAEEASLEAYTIFSPTRNFVGLRVQYKQTTLGIGDILKRVNLGGKEFDLAAEIEKELKIGGTQDFEVEYTADYNVEPNEFQACLTLGDEAPVCTRFCSDNGDCDSNSFCLLDMICVPKLGKDSPCVGGDMCKSDLHCAGLDIAGITAGSCQECNSHSDCASDEYCDNTLPTSDFECKAQKTSGLCWGDQWCESGDCSGVDIAGASAGFCSDCNTLDSTSECPDGQFCEAGIKCVDQWKDGAFPCLSNGACENYCVASICNECHTINRNGGCPSGKHCDINYNCINDKGSGVCTHSDECTGSCVRPWGSPVGYCD